MKKYLILIAITIFLIGCNKREPKPLKAAKPNAQKLLKPGEWISEIDSMSGISIREDRLAFFKDMKFTSDKVYEYELIDSLYISSNTENKVGEYLTIHKPKDTLRYKIISKSENSLTLKRGNQNETFNIKRKP